MYLSIFNLCIVEVSVDLSTFSRPFIYLQALHLPLRDSSPLQLGCMYTQSPLLLESFSSPHLSRPSFGPILSAFQKVQCMYTTLRSFLQKEYTYYLFLCLVRLVKISVSLPNARMSVYVLFFFFSSKKFVDCLSAEVAFLFISLFLNTPVPHHLWTSSRDARGTI